MWENAYIEHWKPKSFQDYYACHGPQLQIAGFTHATPLHHLSTFRPRKLGSPLTKSWFRTWFRLNEFCKATNRTRPIVTFHQTWPLTVLCDHLLITSHSVVHIWIILGPYPPSQVNISIFNLGYSVWEGFVTEKYLTVTIEIAALLATRGCSSAPVGYY